MLLNILKKWKQQHQNMFSAVAKDMYVPITSATLNDFIQMKRAPVEPEQQVIDSKIPIPDIQFTTTEEMEKQPYKEINTCRIYSLRA